MAISPPISNNENLEKLVTTTEEEIVIVNVADLDLINVIPNLKWLIKMCLDNKMEFGKVIFN